MLTLRPTGLSPPVYGDQLDYIVIEDGRAIGRMYEDWHALPELRWFWSITVFVGYRPGVTTHGQCRLLRRPRHDFCRTGKSAAQTRTRGFMRPDKGLNFEALRVWRIFPRPIIGDFGTIVRLSAISRRNRSTWILLRSCIPADRIPLERPAQTPSLSRSA
jgi:hypothetical protein